MRKLQFSLRALLVAIFGACCFFGGMHVGARRERWSLYNERVTLDHEQRLMSSTFKWLYAESRRLGKELDLSEMPRSGNGNGQWFRQDATAEQQ